MYGKLCRNWIKLDTRFHVGCNIYLIQIYSYQCRVEKRNQDHCRMEPELRYCTSHVHVNLNLNFFEFFKSQNDFLCFDAEGSGEREDECVCFTGCYLLRRVRRTCREVRESNYNPIVFHRRLRPQHLVEHFYRWLYINYIESLLSSGLNAAIMARRSWATRKSKFQQEVDKIVAQYAGPSGSSDMQV